MLKTLGRYQIADRIGAGAMADVYCAHDPTINRALAIKVLKPEFRRDPEYAGRFLRESKAAGALSHPNIVTIFDVGEESGYPYIAMEMLEGEPLDALIERGIKAEAAEVARIGLQLAEALSYAHGLGVVHRDIKPSNIVLLKDRRTIKLLDFGIASLPQTDFSRDDATLRTQVGQVLGTPRYMSPEQTLGAATDLRSDLFSVGVVLYELLTGRHAFSGPTPTALALQIAQVDPVPIAKLAPDCPAGLQFIVGKLLNKRPERRFADGEQLAVALRREMAELGPTKSVARSLPLPIRMTLITASVTAAALLLSLGAVQQRQDKVLRQMAITSGAAITSFVASNAAVTAAENAGLPPDQRDWAPIQAFVRTALADSDIRRITVVDGEGMVRASSRQNEVGLPYRPPAEPVAERRSGLTVSDSQADGGAFRFVEPITYAGRPFGKVDVSVSKSDLNAASSLSHDLLGLLALVVAAAVVAASYVSARKIASPLNRLKAALTDMAAGDLNFRISHRRRDEFGDLFDAFNRLAAVTQGRLDLVGHRPAADVESGEPLAGPFAPPSPAGLAPRHVVAAEDRTEIVPAGARATEPELAASAATLERFRRFLGTQRA